jgi:hypothetical protein
MIGPVISIANITASAHQAADSGLSVDACPYPSDWPAAYRWRLAFHSREKEIRPATGSIRANQ